MAVEHCPIRMDVIRRVWVNQCNKGADEVKALLSKVSLTLWLVDMGLNAEAERYMTSVVSGALAFSFDKVRKVFFLNTS